MSTLVSDTRALMRMFVQSSYRDLYVRSGDVSVFIARDGGGANPMIATARIAPAADGVTHIATTWQLTAPHVATLIWTAAEGDVVEHGTTIARIALLDEEIALTADAAGTVQAAQALPGALIEFGDVILTVDG
ncbi:hypothetical protein [Blastomonas sp.]|uniref:hypothetical protein n=1 Tax=Blastomonas sp. TaxID=1909299 RepID=UPI00391C5A4E